MSLRDYLKAAGLAHELGDDGTLWVNYGTNHGTKQKLKAQSCEVALLVMNQCLPKAMIDRRERELLADLSLKIAKFGALTPNQLVMVQRLRSGGKPGGLITEHAQQLEQAGFDLEQLFDQAPHAEDDGEQKITVQCESVGFATAKAWQMKVGSVLAWFPKSLCAYSPEAGTLTAPKWLLKAKGVAI